MPKPKRTRTANSANLRAQGLDLKLFRRLYILFYEVACQENVAQVSRLLGISRKRATQLWDEALLKRPIELKGVWWNDILRILLMEHSTFLLTHARATYRERGREIRSEMKDMKLLGFEDDHAGSHNIGDEDINPEEEAHQIVLATLAGRPGLKMNLEHLALHTGLSKRIVRLAADRLGLIREVEGFGEDKRATYRIPTLEDFRDTRS